MEDSDVTDELEATQYKIDIDIEIYMRHREQPLQVRSLIAVDHATLEEGDPLECLMDYLEYYILQVMDTRGEERYVFSDSHFNKRIVMVSDVQSISLLAPDFATLQTIMALAED